MIKYQHFQIKINTYWLLVLITVLGVVSVSRQQVVAEANRAEAAKLLALAQLALDDYPTAAVAFTLASRTPWPWLRIFGGGFSAVANGVDWDEDSPLRHHATRAIVGTCADDIEIISREELAQ